MWPCRCGAVLTFPPCAPDLWVLYNLGAIYWRIEGRAGKALDCVRMALHHSPHDKKVGKKRVGGEERDREKHDIAALARRLPHLLSLSSHRCPH